MSQKQLGATRKANRIFSKKELQEFSKGYMQLALEGIDADALVSKNSKTSRFGGFDAVVLALGARSVNSLKEELKERVPEIYIIGDALAPRQAIHAIEEGARIAPKI